MKIKRSARMIALALVAVMLFGMLPMMVLPATAAQNVVEIGKGTQTYSLFNSGATASGYGQYRDTNPAPATHNNNGYDLYGTIGSASRRRFRLGQSFSVNTTITEQAVLTIKAYDVDEDYPACGRGCEYDYVDLVDETTGGSVRLDGHLSGQNNTWNNTSFRIDPSLLKKDHTYHFEVYMTCTGGHSCTYYSVIVRTVSLLVSNPTEGEEAPIDADLSASISANGTVSVNLMASAAVAGNYILEYKAVHAASGSQCGGKEYSVSIPNAETPFNTTFRLEGSQKGAYVITVYVKNASGNVLLTRDVSAGWSYAAVSYNANGGSNNLPIDGDAYTNGSTVTVLFNYIPSKAGYTFLGWSRNSGATTPEFTKDGAKTFTIGDSNVTLYAVWGKIADTPHVHTPGEWIIDRKPSCTTSGLKHTACTGCGEHLENIYVPALGHSYKSVVTRAVTCTTPGITTHTCQTCGDSYLTYVYAEHHYALTEDISATCTQDGKKVYTCSNCSDSYVEVIPGGHDYVAEVTQVASPSQEGKITYTCANCGDHYDETIPARPDASVLLVQDKLPWSHNDNADLLNRLVDSGYITGWDVATTSTLGALNLANYNIILIANDQSTSGYNALGQHSALIASFASAGGVVIYGACDNGWSGGDIHHALPENVTKDNFYSRYNYIVDKDHPIVSGVLTDGKSLTDTLLYGNYCSHTYFNASTLPAGTNVILQDAHGNPTLVEYAVGDGYVIASGLTWEFYYSRNSYAGGANTYSRSVFDDLLVYAVYLSDPCDHAYSEEEVVPPTCSEQGYTLHTCELCGAQMKSDFVDAKGHTPGAWETGTPASAGTAGLEVRKCTGCGEIMDREVLPPLDSPVAKVETEEDSVVVGQHLTVYIVIDKCTPLKKLEILPVFDGSAFTFVSGEWLVDADSVNVDASTGRATADWSSATDVNRKVYKIVLVANEMVENVKVSANVTMQSNSGTSGLTVVEREFDIGACLHAAGTLADLDGTYHSRTCNACGHVDILTHTYTDSCDATCDGCGHERAPHHSTNGSYEKDGAAHWQVCTACGEKVSVTPHTFGALYRFDETHHAKKCSVCEYVEKIAHAYDDGQVTEEATHLKKGEKLFTCADCNATYTEEIDKLPGHTFSGWTFGGEAIHRQVCPCGEVIEEPHAFDDGVVTQVPSHVEFGTKTYTCAVCGYKDLEKLDKTTDHGYNDWTPDNERTHTGSCACGEHKTEDHTFDAGVVKQEATHFEEGALVRTCTVCGYKKTEVLAKLDAHIYGDWQRVDDETHQKICACDHVLTAPHTWDEGVTVTPPTQEAVGAKRYTCTDCGVTKTEELEKLPATPEEPNQGVGDQTPTEEPSGCGATVSASFGTVMLLIACAALSLRKKEQDNV